MTDTGLEIVRLGAGDSGRVMSAGAVFDEAPRPDAVERFLAEPGHHLLIAYQDDTAAGFVSGVEMTHPDKGTEMFLYELGVEKQYRRRGIGVALVAALAAIARERGCYGMWTATEGDNSAALATYARAGATRKDGGAILAWEYGAP